ncbi:MAG: hypothetical protein AAF928_01200 [Myxococcota bacterium]
MWRPIATLGLGLLAACGGGDGATAPLGAGGNGTDGGGAGASGGLVGGGFDDRCDDETRSIFLLGRARELVSFDPATEQLSAIGVLNCPVGAGPNVPSPTPFSMAVDRTGTAWVSYSNGELYAVDTHDASCRGTPFVAEQLAAFRQFGMGFASRNQGSLRERLFLSSFAPGDGIAKLDLETFTLERVGYYDGGLRGPAALTGTADARLYGYFLSTPVRIIEIDSETSSQLSETALPDLDVGNAWAFAFWGDYFYLFTANPGQSSRIERVRRGTDVVELVSPDAGLRIVGAGVSTCAPTEPPVVR